MSADRSAAYNAALSKEFPEKLDENATVVTVGLDFGPSWVNAHFLVNENQYYTGVACGQEYKDFYEEALRKKVQSRLNFKELPSPDAPLISTEERASELVQHFLIHIKEARNMGISALEHNPSLNLRVLAITVPHHWDISARTLVAKAAELAGQPLDGSHMLLELPQAVQLAYEMRNQATGAYLTLIIMYQKSHLHLMLVEMQGSSCVMKGEVYLPHLGEEVLKAPIVGSAVGSGEETFKKNAPGDKPPAYDGPSPHDEPPSPAHHSPPVDLKPIQEALKKFLLLMTPTPDDSTSRTESPGLLLRSEVIDVKFVVIDGEASGDGLERLHEAVTEMLAKAERVIVIGNKPDCGAVGAERAGQRQLQNPMHVGDWREL